ncbi:MAG: hypothetical protein HRT99_03690 [Mycoplasmatales bacterium]|nr:hypothetical protein [Mycoplasmatales bacterium]
MTLWIIIGSLVGVVAIFLIVMSIRDKKKIKETKIANEKLEKSRVESKDNVKIFLNQVILKNQKLLDDFVPSVGKYKMGDIRAGSKAVFENFRKTEEYNLAKSGEKNQDLMNIFENFSSTNSNVWPKKLKKEIEKIANDVKKMDKELIKIYTPKVKELIKKAYK